MLCCGSCRTPHGWATKVVYNEVVQNLANRGFRLGALLDFWQELLEGHESMYDFDPSGSAVSCGTIVKSSGAGLRSLTCGPVRMLLDE